MIAQHAKTRTSVEMVRTPMDVVLKRFKVRRLLPVVTELAKVLPAGLWIGGGSLPASLAGYVPGDVDVWGVSHDALEEFRVLFENLPKSAKLLRKYSLHPRSDPDRLGATFTAEGLPLIASFDWACFTGPDNIADTFDFTICCMALDGETLVHHPTALDDLEARKLVLHRPYPQGYARARKYIKRGFTLAPECRSVIAATHIDGDNLLRHWERKWRVEP